MKTESTPRKYTDMKVQSTNGSKQLLYAEINHFGQAAEKAAWKVLFDSLIHLGGCILAPLYQHRHLCH